MAIRLVAAEPPRNRFAQCTTYTENFNRRALPGIPGPLQPVLEGRVHEAKTTALGQGTVVIRMSTVPPEFGEEFLTWLRQATEAAWAHRPERTFQDYVQARTGGMDWQQGTRWSGGLTEPEISAIEARNHFKFPPDY